ncbi:MAG: Hsp20/alpha crystallin family protein [Armatimonadetes bacterium]|nr:Hsp20/alpha crystallin family protein [Armatimonadota bacterium]
MPRKELDEWILQMGLDMHRLSNEMVPAAPKLAMQKEWAPRIDVLETPGHVLVKAELAGVRTGQFVIQYSPEKHVLLVRGERAAESLGPDIPTLPHQLEIDYGQFAREIRLPDVPLDVNLAQAHIACGMLTVLIPKSQAAEETHVIVERTITVRRRIT